MAFKCPHEQCESKKTWKASASLDAHINGHLNGAIAPTFEDARAFWQRWLDDNKKQQCDVCSNVVSKSHGRHSKCKRQPQRLVEEVPAQIAAPLPEAAPRGSVRVPPSASLPSWLEIVNCGNIPTKALPSPSCALKFVHCITKTFGYMRISTHDPRCEIGWKGYFMLVKCLLHTIPNRSGRRGLSATEINRRMDLWLNGDWDVLWRSALESAIPRKPPSDSKKSKAKRAIQLIAQERLSDASKALLSKGMAPNNAETLENLRSKHPVAPPPHVPDDLPPAFRATCEQVSAALKKFPKGSAPGFSRITAEVLRLAERFPDTKEFLPMLTDVVNRVLSGEVPASAVPIFAGGELIALNKCPGVRPIAMGDLVRKIATSCVVVAKKDDIRAFFEPLQFALGTKNGGELISYRVREYIEKNINNPDACIVQLDAINAWNTSNRALNLKLALQHFPDMARVAYMLYGEHSWLRYNGERAPFDSAEGVAQGCLLGVFLFALSVHCTVAQPVAQAFPSLEVHGWYADDSSFGGPIQTVFNAIKMVEVKGEDPNYGLNMTKCEVFFPITLSGGKPASDPFDARMKRATDGIVSLGSPIGTPKFVQDYVDTKVNAVKQLIDMIECLDNPQCQWLMMRNLSFGKLGSRLRTVPTELALPAAKKLDELVSTAFSRLVGVPWLTDFQFRTLSLGSKLGGLGVRSAQLHASAARVASFTSSRAQLIKLGGPPLTPPSDMAYTVQHLKSNLSAGFVIDLEKEYTQKGLSKAIDIELKNRLLDTAPTKRDRAALIARSAPHSAAFLRQIPTKAKWRMPDRYMTSLLRQRLGLPIGDVERPCPAPHCDKICDVYGVHAMSCMRSHDMIGKHNLICEFLAKKLRKVGYVARTEVQNLSVGPHTKERPADILVVNYERGRDRAFDVTVANPLKKSAIEETLKGDVLFAAKDLHTAKVNKYNELKPNVEVVPLAFQSLGGHTEQVSALILDIAKRLKHHKNKASSIIKCELIVKISFILMKGVAAQILKRCNDFPIDAPPHFVDIQYPV